MFYFLIINIAVSQTFRTRKFAINERCGIVNRYQIRQSVAIKETDPVLNDGGPSGAGQSATAFQIDFKVVLVAKLPTL